MKTSYTDRELLEAAAKAAGIPGEWCEFHSSATGDVVYGIGNPRQHRWGDKLWNPLVDDGDALRLAIRLEFDLRVRSTPMKITVQAPGGHWIEETDGDKASATRRAIVRAAAAMMT